MDDGTALLLAAERDWRESMPQKMYADWCDENSMPTRAGIARGVGLFWGGYGDGGDGGYGGDGYGGGGDGGGGDGGDGGDGYGNYGGDGGLTKRTISEALAMKEGLSIITVASGYNPYVLVGWARPGDLFVDLYGCRLIRRFGGQAQLANLAKKGLQANTELLDPSEYESIGIACIGRVIPCNEAAWKKECPRPAAFG